MGGNFMFNIEPYKATGRIPLYSPEFPIVLFWSQKSGCTTLTKWFFFQINMLELAFEYNPWRLHEKKYKFYEQHGYNDSLISVIDSRKKEIYKLVRNPFTRAISSYFQQLRENLLSLENNSISFKGFLYYLKKNIEGLWEGHCSRQYIYGEENVISKYIHLEKFEDEIKGVENEHQLLDSPISKIIPSDHHNQEKEIFIPSRPIADIIFKWEDFEKSIPHYSYFYDDETEELVKNIYKIDFEIYEYSTSFR